MRVCYGSAVAADSAATQDKLSTRSQAHLPAEPAGRWQTARRRPAQAGWGLQAGQHVLLALLGSWDAAETGIQVTDMKAATISGPHCLWVFKQIAMCADV